MKIIIIKILNIVIKIIENPSLTVAKYKKINMQFLRDISAIKKHFKSEINTVIDVGAALGEYSKAANFEFPKAQIYSFEPIPESFNILIKTINSKNIKYINFALDYENCERDFYLNEFSFSSSLLKMTELHKKEFPFTKNEKKIRISCKRLDSLSEIVIKRPCLIKMDVQGAELRVLKGAGNLIEQFDVIQLEVNFEKFYNEQANYDQIFSFMINNKFNKFIQLDPFYSNNGKLLACDLVFFR